MLPSLGTNAAAHVEQKQHLMQCCHTHGLAGEHKEPAAGFPPTPPHPSTSSPRVQPSSHSKRTATHFSGTLLKLFALPGRPVLLTNHYVCISENMSSAPNLHPLCSRAGQPHPLCFHFTTQVKWPVPSPSPSPPPRRRFATFARDQVLDSKVRILKRSLSQDFTNMMKRIAEVSPCSTMKKTDNLQGWA